MVFGSITGCMMVVLGGINFLIMSKRRVSRSKRAVVRYVYRSLRSMVVPGIGVFVKRVTVNNGDFGVRRCLEVTVWEIGKSMYSGIVVWAWEDSEILWEVLKESYHYGEVMINDVYTTYQYQVCPTCLGKRIILMHKP